MAEERPLRQRLLAIARLFLDERPFAVELLRAERAAAGHLLVDRLEAGEVSARQALGLAYGVLDLGVEPLAERLGLLLGDRSVDMRCRSVVFRLMTSGGLVDDLPEEIAPIERLAICEQILLDRFVLAAAEPGDDEPWLFGDARSAAERVEVIEEVRLQLGVPAAAVYRPVLSRAKLADVHDRLLDAVVAEGGEAGQRLLEELLEGASDERARTRLRRALMRVKTQRIAPQRPEAVLGGYALLSNADASGDFVVIGCFEGSHGLLRTAHLTLKTMVRITGASVASHRTEENLQRLVERLSGGSRELRRVPLDEVADMLRATLHVDEDGPEDAPLALALFAQALPGGEPFEREPPSPDDDDARPELSQVRGLLKRREFHLWAYGKGDLEAAGLPPPAEPDDGWYAEAGRRLADSPEIPMRWAAMRFMSLWYEWSGDDDSAELCAAVAADVRRDHGQSLLMRAMLEETIRCARLLSSKPELPVGDEALRAALRPLCSGEALDGRALASLDFAEAAYLLLEHRAEPPRWSSEPQRLRWAAAVGRAFAGQLQQGRPGPQQDPEETLGRMTLALSQQTGLADDEAYALLQALLPGLHLFVLRVCVGCPVACITQPYLGVEEAFHAREHPSTRRGG